MTKIKLCGIRRMEDIDIVNRLCPDYIGFVFVKGRKRCVEPDKALELRQSLNKNTVPVGVFIDEDVGTVAELVQRGVIDAVQLHGSEDNEYISRLRSRTDALIIQAFQIKGQDDIERAKKSTAGLILLDSGTGTGKSFSHELIGNIGRPYFLAGGLTPDNVGQAVAKLSPYGVDASSSLETDGFKDRNKMTAFVKAVRKDIEK